MILQKPMTMMMELQKIGNSIDWMLVKTTALTMILVQTMSH